LGKSKEEIWWNNRIMFADLILQSPKCENAFSQNECEAIEENLLVISSPRQQHSVFGEIEIHKMFQP
jgi:hypothetical protein